jgi:hypothetical protein
MKKIALFSLSLVVISSLTAFDAAALKKGTGPRGQSLTGDECRGLGGTVVIEKGCTSGQSCETRDQNGVIHEVCLTAKSAPGAASRINPGKIIPKTKTPAVKGQ